MSCATARYGCARVVMGSRDCSVTLWRVALLSNRAEDRRVCVPASLLDCLPGGVNDLHSDNTILRHLSNHTHDPVNLSTQRARRMSRPRALRSRRSVAPTGAGELSIMLSPTSQSHGNLCSLKPDLHILCHSETRRRPTNTIPAAIRSLRLARDAICSPSILPPASVIGRSPFALPAPSPSPSPPTLTKAAGHQFVRHHRRGASSREGPSCGSVRQCWLACRP